MAEQRGSGSSIKVVLGLLGAALAAGGAAAWFTFSMLEPAPTPTTAPGVEVPNNPSTTAQAENQVEVYWLQSDGQKISLAPSGINLDQKGASETEILEAALNRLLQGPANADVTTTIPKGTQLNSLKLDAEGVHVDLSPEFTTGGGSTSMQGRVAQVLYTATTLDSKARVWLTVNGEPLKVLGGEGLILDQPLTRRSFQENFSL